jgi:putative salt-induced outer membrane protein YdiY
VPENQSFGSTIFLLLTLFLPSLASSGFGEAFPRLKVKHKTDVVVMENGDRFTGEIKKMEFGILYLKSDRAVDTLKLDWERVVQVRSIARYEFETGTKDIYVGTLAISPEKEVRLGELEIVQDDSSPVRLKVNEIISVHEMGRSILSRINLSLDAGASFTSANKRTQSNLNLSLSFRKPKYSTSLTASSLFSAEPDTTKTARHELQIVADRYLGKKWDAVSLAAFLHDNQQNLQLRTTVGGGFRRNLIETNRTVFYALGGAVYTNENYFEVNHFDRNNAEGLAALGFSTYRFRGSSFNAGIWVFPSLSDPGRLRVDSTLNWKWDIVSDLYFKINLIDNYDNQPPPNGIHSNLSITTTMGWSF